jgi:hypothetical protein
VQTQQRVFNTGDNFELTLLAGSNPTATGSVIEMIGPHLRAMVSMDLPFSSAVKVQSGGILLLGDVCHCESKDGAYVATIVARHMTAGLPGLQNLYHALREYQAEQKTPTAEETVDVPVR